MPDYMVPPASRNDIKVFANRVRRLFHLHEIETFPVMEFVEIVLTKIDPSFNYEIVSDAEMGSDQANYSPVSNTMRIRNSVYEGAYNGNGRDRFTVAHELGHYFLHSDVSLSRADDNINVPAYRNPEWQANTFAAALLMPDHIIKDMGPSQIAQRCGTSYSAAAIAYNNLKKKRPS